MKSYIITFISILIVSIAIAGNGNMTNEKERTRLISGKVVDKLSGEEIAGAEIKIADKVVYTDLNGNFLTNIPSAATAAVISFISYNETTITIDSYSYGEVVVALESK